MIRGKAYICTKDMEGPRQWMHGTIDYSEGLRPYLFVKSCCSDLICSKVGRSVGKKNPVIRMKYLHQRLLTSTICLISK